LLNRAAVIRGFAQAATQRHVVSVTARYDGRRDRWRLEVAGTAELVDQLEHDLHADPAAARYTDQIDFTITEETTA
jgi:hypothetical protein